jgi:hypothetical protein
MGNQLNIVVEFIYQKYFKEQNDALLVCQFK